MSSESHNDLSPESSPSPTVELKVGDAFDVLDELPEESVHALVSDPPYGLAFMGASWDDFEPVEYQEWCEEWARKALRVLKPGGHLLAFSGSRTHHRLFAGVEDAGFEVRDTISWVYGSGFPKGQAIDKYIDDYYGASDHRPVVGHTRSGIAQSFGDDDDEKWNQDGGVDEVGVSRAATFEARRWEGWRTQLKPAAEYVVLARKPLESATYKNCLKHATGALNVRECRVGDEVLDSQVSGQNSFEGFDMDEFSGARTPKREGRYPSNVLLDEEAAQDLDEQVEEDHGIENASRVYYCPKPQTAERSHDGNVDNDHPTVKPIDLMEYLIKLVTQEGQTIIDPFSGSGTTLLAADNIDRKAIGIERSEEYADIIESRLVAEGITYDRTPTPEPDTDDVAEFEA